MFKAITNAFKATLRHREIRRNKIEFSSDYYEATSDLKANLRKYEQAVEAIKAKYERYLLEQENTVYKDITNELRLAKINFNVRAENFSLRSLREGVELERTYGKTERAAELKKIVSRLERKEKLLTTKSMARWDITDQLLKDIREDINPYGKRAENPKDWSKMVDRLEVRLEEKNIVLDGQEYDGVIKGVWTSVRKEIAAENERERTQALEEKLAKVEEIKRAEAEKEQLEKEAEKKDWESYWDAVHETERRKEESTSKKSNARNSQDIAR